MKNKELIFTNGILDVNTIVNFLHLDYFKATSSECNLESALLAVLIVTIFGIRTNILGEKMALKDLIKSKDKKILILGELILRYMMISYFNSQSFIKSSSGCTVTLSTDLIPFCNTKILTLSCDPNIKWSHVGSSVGFYACKPIKQGQPLLLSTAGSYHTTSKIDRYDCLKRYTDDYQPCRCTACVENWSTLYSLPSYKSMTLAIPKRIQREFDRIMLKFKERLELIRQGNTKQLLTIKDELNRMNDKFHHYMTVPCREISLLHFSLSATYSRLDTINHTYQ
ncbi:uncharacterized protein LOC122850595 [Aphidius gifuensis]|uniref:uncharacterized protein LOC122850595 n=1 Tax=Aphidius gifuensis TaxID=684658 RepID=UPI001CDBDDCA|nr:uncharacterized protein LOC122850595 [Aphidius gifuensis]